MTERRRPDREPDSDSGVEVVAADDGAQQAAHVGAGPAEPLVARVLGASGLGEPLRIGGAQRRVGVRVADVPGDDGEEYQLRDGDDYVTVAAGIGGAVRHPGGQFPALGGKVPEPGPGEQVDADRLIQRARRGRVASGLILVRFCDFPEVLDRGRPELVAQLVHCIGQGSVEVGPQVPDLLGIPHPQHGAVGLVEGVLGQLRVPGPRQGKVPYFGIFPDRQQLLAESGLPSGVVVPVIPPPVKYSLY